MSKDFFDLKSFNLDERDFQVVAFDIDGTLSKSKLPLEWEMARLLEKLLEHKQVAILSGGGFEQYQKQILDKLNFVDKKYFANLFLFPTNAACFYIYRNGWKKVYNENFSIVEKKRIIACIKKALKIAELEEEIQTYGKNIEDRGGQITFSALGQQAPLNLKKAWDPDHKKKDILQKILAKMLPQFSVKVGGSTSVDITKKGIDKAYGLKYFMNYLKVQKNKIIYVGDALFPGGNDEVVLSLSIKAVNVKDEMETEKLLHEIISNILRNKKQSFSPEVEVRPWGQMEEFEFNEKVSTKIIKVKKGEELSLQSHKLRGEFWKVLSGNPEIVIGILSQKAKQGEEFFIKKGVKHQIKAPIDDVEILEIAKGEFKDEDIVRYKDKYGRS